MTYSEQLAHAPVRFVTRITPTRSVDDALRDQLEYLIDARHNSAASPGDCDRLVRVMGVLLETFACAAWKRI
jgi:hypothetical protein